MRKPRRSSRSTSSPTRVSVAAASSSPAIVSWRSALALALRTRHDEGAELARTELARTELARTERCDVDRARGVALRALGRLEGGQAGLRRRSSARALARTPEARLGDLRARRARTAACAEGSDAMRSPDPARDRAGVRRAQPHDRHVRLPAALRRANRRRDALAPLDRALEVALVCGSGRLAERAREISRRSGRGHDPSRCGGAVGDASLAPSEPRVCRLGPRRLMNREIARALFLSIKTAETHVGNAHRKFELSTRAELAGPWPPAPGGHPG